MISYRTGRKFGLERRGPGEPVPVIFPVSTWDPDRYTLHGWLRNAWSPTSGRWVRLLPQAVLWRVS